jgi:hypothetical protein
MDEPELIPTPWYLEVADDLSLESRISLPEGDVEMIICDSMGTPMFKLEIRQKLDHEKPAADNETPSVVRADMDVFSATNYGPDPPEWAPMIRGIIYQETVS